MTDQLATVGFDRAEAAMVATVSGEVDMSNADQLLARVLAEVGQTPSLIMDLSGCSYLDSAGLGAIARIESACRERGIQLRLVVPAGTSIDRVLAMTGMHEVLMVDRSVGDAVARVGSDATGGGSDR